MVHTSPWVQALPSLHGVPDVGMHAPVAAEQAEQPVQVVVSFCHAPEALHVSGCATPLHCFDPGVQIPVQAPLVESQTYVHAFPLACHWPFGPHDCG